MTTTTIATFRPAIESDAQQLLGQAIRDSERAHTGTGIWDVAVGEDADPTRSLANVLGYACLHRPDCHFHYSHFIIGEVEGEAAAAGCAFVYPAFSATKSFPAISYAAQQVRGMSVEDSTEMWGNISFLDDVFPDYDYNNTWMLESIFVSEKFRKCGIALQMINALFDMGREKQVKECLVVCAIGNKAAYRVYEKAGFECLGEGRSAAAEEALGSEGFHLFRKAYWSGRILIFYYNLEPFWVCIDAFF